jgi:phage FluMu protein Com
MNSNSGDEAPNLTVLRSVRCLECGAVYAKPSGGGTVQQNPGCPECGYVGWVPETMKSFNESWPQHHSGAGRLPHRSG